MNQTLIEKVRCILSQTRLSKAFWAEAISYLVHLVNRLPVSRNGGKTPLEVWSDTPVSDYDKLHVFGCLAYSHVTDSKLDPRAKKDKFMGFSKGKIENNDEALKQVEKVVFSPDMVAPTKESIDQVDNNSNVLE
ncbi:uncharacterized protein LOC111453497 [Cucurbita moschata]|uniref:Uncharacterized protein LOC111453497 n=1 Tax=Cucurbita moschata TaxID=3662 RepID=A0A6J1GEP0_CUCMO|nr:uncharacterized protein LOC111453497 [Cucurbita moschata]